MHDARLEFVEPHQPFTEIVNPYIIGSPITSSEMFYGREADLAFLLDSFIRTNAQTVLVLYGQRRAGKTTLLNQLASTTLLAQHIAVKIDLQKIVMELDLGKFFFRIAREINKALLDKNLPLPALQRTDFSGPGADPQDAFEDFLDQLQIVLNGRRLLLLFDELEELENQVKNGQLKPEIFKYLRGLMQERHNFHFLFSGTHQIYELTHSYWSVFFQLARHYQLPNKISPRGAEDLIMKPVSNLEYEPLAVKKIRLLTADQPYLINLVCFNLVARCNMLRKNYVTINDVNQVQKDVLETGTIHFDWLWVDKLVTHERQMLLLLIAEACKDEGRQLDLEDVCSLYENYGIEIHPDTVAQTLKALVAEDIIEQTDVTGYDGAQENARYTLANGLLRHWLRQKKSINRLLQEMHSQPEKRDNAQKNGALSAASNGSDVREHPKDRENSQYDDHSLADNEFESEASGEAAKSRQNGNHVLSHQSYSPEF